MRHNVSLVVIARDEEEFLPRCLASVAGKVDEIIVVDTGSTDQTMAIAEEHGAKVIEFPWCDDFSAARNAGLEHVTSDWVLQLDADEELVSSLRYGGDGVMCEIDAGNGQVFPVCRLFRSHLRYTGIIHEQVTPSNPVRLPVRINHFGPTLEDESDRQARVIRNIRILTKALASGSGPTWYMHAQLGQELFSLGHYEDAYQAFFQAAELAGDNTSAALTFALRNACLCKIELGDPTTALQIVNTLIDRYPGFTDLYMVKAQALANLGHSDGAIRALRVAVRMGDADPLRFQRITGVAELATRKIEELSRQCNGEQLITTAR